jgi:hypothetical protein
MLLLKEYRRMEKCAESAGLRRKILISLHKEGWNKLCSLILGEERKTKVVTEKFAVEFAIDLDSLAYSNEDPKVIGEKLKYHLISKIGNSLITWWKQRAAQRLEVICLSQRIN